MFDKSTSMGTTAVGAEACANVPHYPLTRELYQHAAAPCWPVTVCMPAVCRPVALLVHTWTYYYDAVHACCTACLLSCIATVTQALLTSRRDPTHQG